MAAETCAVCGDSVPFDAAAHVLLNPPDDPVVDGYLCPSCYDEHFEGILQYVEAPETGDDEGGESEAGEGEGGGGAVGDEAVEADDGSASDESEAADGDDEPTDPVDADR